MLEQLKSEVCRANLQLVAAGLVIETWGNASGVDRKRGLMVIKPSGVPYKAMVPARMVVVALDTGKRVKSELNPSSDTPTQPLRHRVGAGRVWHSVLWHNPGRLLVWRGAVHALARAERDQE